MADAAFAFRRRDAKNVRDKVQIGDAGHKLIHIRIVGYVGESALAGEGVLFDGDAVDLNLTFFKAQDAAAALDGGRLARAVVANETVDLARLDAERKIVDSRVAAVELG